MFWESNVSPDNGMTWRGLFSHDIPEILISCNVFLKKDCSNLLHHCTSYRTHLMETVAAKLSCWSIFPSLHEVMTLCAQLGQKEQTVGVSLLWFVIRLRRILGHIFCVVNAEIQKISHDELFPKSLSHIKPKAPSAHTEIFIRCSWQ